MNPQDLIDALLVNDGLNMKMLDHCSDEMMEFKPGKGKTIRSNFTHMIGMRRAYLESRKGLGADQIEKLDWQTTSRVAIREQLEISGKLLIDLVGIQVAECGAGRQSPIRFVVQLLMHEANHRAQIELAWRLNGCEPDNAFLYSLWEWKPNSVASE